MDLIDKVIRKLKKYKVPYSEVAYSDKPTKKLMLNMDGKIIHFGAKGSNTYIEGAPIEKRNAYRARHQKIFLKDGRRAIDVKYSPAWLSYYILW